MAATIELYDHTIFRFTGANAAGDTYKLMLCSAVTFDATATTLAGVTKTEIAAANGYSAGGVTLTGVVLEVAGTSGMKFDAENVSLSASGGSISASYGILYNDTDTDDPPVCVVDFGGTVTAVDGGAPFGVEWDPAGIVSFQKAS